MLLRRVSEHVREQNWFAVGLDFAIVVFGVFVGLQVANWNADRADRAAYRLALERYEAEVLANLEDLKALEAVAEERRQTVEAGLNALLTCADTPENRDALEAAASTIEGTMGLSVRTITLEELTEVPAMLAQQSPEERQLLSQTRHEVDYLLREADFLERLPLQENPMENPIFVLMRKTELVEASYGENETVRARPAMLAAPVDIACKDNDLVKSLDKWEKWQGNVPVIARTLRTHLGESLEVTRRTGAR